MKIQSDSSTAGYSGLILLLSGVLHTTEAEGS
jgi:hypothetical protein